jgi:hypothetical protein
MSSPIDLVTIRMGGNTSPFTLARQKICRSRLKGTTKPKNSNGMAPTAFAFMPTLRKILGLKSNETSLPPYVPFVMTNTCPTCGRDELGTAFLIHRRFQTRRVVAREDYQTTISEKCYHLKSDSRSKLALEILPESSLALDEWRWKLSFRRLSRFTAGGRFKTCELLLPDKQL